MEGNVVSVLGVVVAIGAGRGRFLAYMVETGCEGAFVRAEPGEADRACRFQWVLALPYLKIILN